LVRCSSTATTTGPELLEGHLHSAVGTGYAIHMQVSHDVVQAAPREPVEEELLVEDDLLVEDVSIDGMCGVY
jgi:mycofactocin precursor